MLTYRITALIMLGTLACPAANAQYVWVDEKGNKQFSDTPPPVSVPKNRIIKGGAPTPKTETDNSNTQDAASAPAKPMTTAEKNQDFNKRRAEQAIKDKKAADEQQANADKANNCERAKNYQKILDSGVRVTTTDKNGERSYLSDSQREKEAADIKKALSDCK
ncbi:DUF4124 domain-containing protein [Undibacterium griseum]|uniref:DUF4124 domain-containing protein n=1 Tax=Undibacterium griseum TaxID=2762295 RepID=A0ABR6YM84_9BURK|nr:DUF4124 domain-containing protein [Undibacterium griseum]MBC3884923.1 DUF4124 domain-containing protein [Undibacterium griseum]